MIMLMVVFAALRSLVIWGEPSVVIVLAGGVEVADGAITVVGVRFCSGCDGVMAMLVGMCLGLLQPLPD